MIDQVNINNILFLDIETVPMVATYAEMPERMQHLWDKKAERLQPFGKEPLTPVELFDRAGG